MKKVKVKPNQTVMDIALEQYGTLEAISEILVNNPELTNDAGALAQLGIDAVNSSGFYPDIMLEADQEIRIDENSELIRSNVIKQIYRDITTFDI